jgi:hypothetical protein
MTRGRFLWLLTGAALQGQDNLKAVYDTKDWLDLRRRIRPGSPILYRAAVAAAMNQVREAERLLQRMIREEDPESVEACDHLINLYMRTGRFGAAHRTTEEALRRNPGRPDLMNAEHLFAALARNPEMRVRRMRYTRLKQSRPGTYIECPVGINGHTAHYLWDSGANFCVTTEQEVRRLGLEAAPSSATLNNSTGGNIGFQLAIARRLEIGGCSLEQVPFLVFRDDQQPFNELAQDERGAIGLPVQLALGGFRWKPEGELELGFPAAGGEPNLCFDGLAPVVECGYGDAAHLPVQLDTGAVTTDLWPPFAKRFRAVTVGRERSRHRISGVGQDVDVDAMVVDRLALAIGGRTVTLAPADVYLEKTLPNSERYYGNVGMDLLRQANQVTLDFRAMRLTLG